MIQPRSIITIADNSGAQIGRIFKVLGGSKKRYASIGEIVVLSVQKPLLENCKEKKMYPRRCCSSKAPFRRADGSYIRFDENAVVIIGKGDNEPIAGRIFGPIPRELGELGFQTIISRAPEVL